jgi:hypothetical protein
LELHQLSALIHLTAKVTYNLQPAAGVSAQQMLAAKSRRTAAATAAPTAALSNEVKLRPRPPPPLSTTGTLTINYMYKKNCPLPQSCLLAQFHSKICLVNLFLKQVNSFLFYHVHLFS